MKKVTSASVFQTAAGMRLSIMYCEIEGGVIVKDNVRVNRILTEPDELAKGVNLLELAQSFVEG